MSQISLENKINLLGLTSKQLTIFELLGEKAFRAKQFMKWVHQYGITDFSLMTDLSKSLRKNLVSIHTFHYLR